MTEETPLPGQDACVSCTRTLSPRWTFCPRCGEHVDDELRTDGGEELGRGVKQFCVECAGDVLPWWFESPGSLTLVCPDCGSTIFGLGTPSNEPFQYNDDGLRADGGRESAETRHSGLATRIVEECDASPPTDIPDDDRLFSDLEDDRTSDALLKLYRKGVLDADWDEDDEETRWWLTEFGAELGESGLTLPFLAALEGDIQLDASPESMGVLQS